MGDNITSSSWGLVHNQDDKSPIDIASPLSSYFITKQPQCNFSSRRQWVKT